MSDTETAPPSFDFTEPQYYLNRELSWLEFNRRVLHQALDSRTPLLERLKFLAIFSSNLDEFFMVRVAGLKQQIEAGVNIRTPDGLTPQEQLQVVRDNLYPMVKEQHQHFDQVLRSELAAHQVVLLDYGKLNQKAKQYLQNYFESHIFPILTPLAVDPSHPFPYISNLSFNLAVVVRDEDREKEYFARIKIPKVLPRFIPLPDSLPQSKSTVWAGVALEQIIAHNLEFLFPGMQIQEWYPFRVTRNADLDVQEDEADDLMLAIEQELRKRRLGGSVVRLEVPKRISKSIRSMLKQELFLEDQDIYPLEGMLGLQDLMSFLSLPLPQLKDPAWVSTIPHRLRSSSESLATSQLSQENQGDILAEIRAKDILVHHPYHAFGATIQRFITQAAHDPDVLAIKMTLYRTSGDSPIVNALIEAAANEKQVVALVELKARFDEENNINWARQLEQAGVHVVYGLVGLKTHTKTTLVVRKEEGEIRRYVHIGTGNYNPKTARLYTDLSLLSCRPQLGADLTDLFNALTGYSRQQSYRKLLVAPVNLRSRMIELIQREMDHAMAGKGGKIIAKMNSLVDPQMIQILYRAAQAGVEIDLIVRGMCCLRPGLKDVSERIRVISIIGRFLEHSRIFYFHNAGETEIYIGSADWMRRNLDRRIEAVVPIEDPPIQQELKALLDLFLKDNRQAWELQSDGTYVQRQSQGEEPEYSAHVILMQQAM
jgi:polyphosphate kinase